MDNNTNIYNIIGRNIKKYRKQNGITQRELAEKMLLSDIFIAKLESSTYQTLSIDTLLQFAKTLNVNIKCFFDEDNEKK